MIDLPNGWDIQPQQEPSLFVFQNGAKSIIIQYVPGSTDEGELFQSGLNTFKQSGVIDVTTTDMKTMLLNNRPALSGLCQGNLDLGKSGKVPLYGLLGSAVLGNGGIYFLSIMNKMDYPTWKEQVKNSFLSIRDEGEEVHKATNIKVVSAVEITGQVGEAQTWKHNLLTLTLAPGWEEKQVLASFEKEIIGWFDYKPITSASMLVVAYKGLLMKESSVLDAAQKTVELSIPNAKLINSYQKELKGKGKATVSVYQGTTVSGGQEVALTAITSTFKAKKCIVNLIGFCGTATNPKELENKMNEVTQSAK